MQGVIQTFLVDVLTALLALATSYASYYIYKLSARLKADTQKIKDEQQLALADTAIDRINDLALKTVERFEQTIAGELRQAVKDGKADRNELLAIGRKAYQEVWDQLSDDMKAAASAEISDVKKYIEDTVEAMVRRIKEQQI
ncbi:MAG: hypothetical protein PWQ93_382 [Clostridiales bacterium]|nr:hypothetical protein [Clostridiales bacterium]